MYREIIDDCISIARKNKTVENTFLVDDVDCVDDAQSIQAKLELIRIKCLNISFSAGAQN